MILEILSVVLPVFLVIAAGYAAARTKIFTPAAVDGLMLFSQRFAIPCVLFRGISRLDLGAAFNPGLLASFYIGVVAVFLIGMLIARRVFHRRPGEAVAIGFAAMFSNTVLLGLPIIERAFGPEEIAAMFAIVSIHAPFCYILGITVMEFTRADGRGPAATLGVAGRAVFSNGLMIGLGLGFLVNLAGIPQPQTLSIAVDMLADAGIPAALFGLGGVLSRYALRASLGGAATIGLLSLVVHPTIVLILGTLVFDLGDPFLRAAVIGASVAPGVNAYIFASMYGRAPSEAAAGVLVSTAACVLTVSGWLLVLEQLL